jgi:hypothetical protein
MLLTTQNSLWAMAHETGGQAIENTNDLAGGLARVDEYERGYYVLGYTPPGGTFAGKGKTPRFHKISLRVKRPGLRVRVRTGYLGVSDPPRDEPKTPGQQMIAAATSPFVAATIPVRATVLPAFTRKDGNFIRALLHVDLDALTPTRGEDGRETVRADVLALVFDEWGELVSRNANTLTIQPESANADLARDRGVVYSLKVPVPRAGGYQIRFSIRDRESGAIGSAGQYIEVDDASHGAFTLSGLLLAEDRDSSAAMGSAAGPVRSTPGDPTRREFNPGDRLVYTYEIYNAREAVETTPSVWHDGDCIFTAPVETLDPGSKPSDSLKVGGGIQLARTLAPGDYVFQLAATSKGSKGHAKTVVRQTDFQVH